MSSDNGQPSRQNNQAQKGENLQLHVKHSSESDHGKQCSNEKDDDVIVGKSKIAINPKFEAEAADYFVSLNALKPPKNPISKQSTTPFKMNAIGTEKNKHTGKRNSKASSYLVFHQIPNNMTTNALENLCSPFGKIKEVRHSKKSKCMFMDFDSSADMESVCRAMQSNIYGLKVILGGDMDSEISHFGKESTNKNNSKLQNNEEDNPIMPRRFFCPERESDIPYLELKPFVTKEHYQMKDSLLAQNDPQRYFAIDMDAHNLERDDVNALKCIFSGEKEYCGGRVITKMTKSVKEFISKKCESSIGKYDVNKKVYISSSGNVGRPNCLQKCQKCERLTDIACGRCKKVFYCGLTCQSRDWSYHRIVCNKPDSVIADYINKKTESIKDLEKCEKSNREVNLPKSGKYVTITSISKANLVFVRSKDASDDLQFFKTIDEIQKIIDDLKPIKCQPKLGEVIIAKFGQQYHRAMALNVENAEIKMILMDYGNIICRPVNELYEAMPHFIDLPRFAIPVHLKGVEDLYLTETLQRYMYNYLESIDFKLIYEETDFDETRGVYSVDLIDPSNNINFNKAILVLVQPTVGEDVCFKNYLEIQPLAPAKDLQLIILDNSNMFNGFLSCTTETRLWEIQKFQKQIQSYGNSFKENYEYAPRPMELCIAKYKDQWCRGDCVELVGDGFPTINFFDYGHISTVAIKLIRPYPSEFSFPILTIDCELEGVPVPMKPELLKRLQDLIKVGEFIIANEIKLMSDGRSHLIYLPSILDQVKSENLLTEDCVKQQKIF